MPAMAGMQAGHRPSYPAMPPGQPQASMIGMHPPASASAAARGSTKWVWWVVALLVLGAGAGAVLALIMK
jgi:hypothetical protein